MFRRSLFLVLGVVFLPATVEAWDHHHHHTSSDQSGCGSHSSGSEVSSAPRASGSSGSTTPSVEAPRKRAFVTSTTYAGALGGVPAADGFCQSSATAAGLPGTYHAWISDRTTSAWDHVQEAGPWSNTDDVEVFAAKASILLGPAAPLLDENGFDLVSTAGAWSGADNAGNASGRDCQGWTDATSAQKGSAYASGSVVELACDQKAPLLCLEQ
jgi:hypothetical protein